MLAEVNQIIYTYFNAFIALFYIVYFLIDIYFRYIDFSLSAIVVLSSDLIFL